MLVRVFRTDPASLVAALTEPAMLARYQQQVADELPSLADPTLVKALRRLAATAQHAIMRGFEEVARTDLPSADELLTDVFAVATWHGWELPIEDHGEQDLPLDGLPRGLLAADANPEGAHLWMIDGTSVALARARNVA